MPAFHQWTLLVGDANKWSQTVWPSIGSTEECVCKYSFFWDQRRSWKDERRGSTVSDEAVDSGGTHPMPSLADQVVWIGVQEDWEAVRWYPCHRVCSTLELLSRSDMFQENLWKKCRAENNVGGALTESGSPQKGVCDSTCPFETTTFPAQAWRRLFGTRKVETYDWEYVPIMLVRQQYDEMREEVGKCLIASTVELLFYLFLSDWFRNSTRSHFG